MAIRIEKPYLRQNGDSVSLCAQITIGACRSEAWFTVESEYGACLTDDRLDAFVVGVLTTAMRMGEDIVCEAPLTRRLKYQLEQYLIPPMAANMEIYHPIAIHAPVTDEALSCAGAVGTGWTGGVDCMYTLMHHIAAQEKSRRLTHLLIASNGALESADNEAMLRTMARRARQGIAKEYPLSVVTVSSNLHLIQDENYLAVAGFRLPAVVLALQKLFGTFLNSGAYEFSRFSFVQENSAYYELLPLFCFETDNTVFYSSGGNVTRIQKLQELSEFPPARKYLHPCIYGREQNCGQCGKCIRTQAALYALDKLEVFAEAFDVAAFYKNKDEILAKVAVSAHSQHYAEVLQVMKQRGMELPPAAQRRVRILRAAKAAAEKARNEKELI
ncbi:MAG: hypothetical protein E7443_03920 [Ruminococcaceae bacterium]|nr:hypothetical protein [Oscillospiraceae bacterium]